MAIKRLSETRQPQTIDLSGPQGNAFVLLGIANRTGRELGLDTAALHAEMTKGDYTNLVRVFNREFGDHFDIIIPDELYEDL